MIVLDLVFALVITVIYMLLLAPILSPYRLGWGVFILFGVLMLLLVWAGAVWFRPLGPLLYGVPWLVMLGLGGIFAMFLVVLTLYPPHGPRHVERLSAHRPAPREHIEDLPPEATALRVDSPEAAVAQTAALTYGLIALVLIVLLLGLIFGNYALVGG